MGLSRDSLVEDINTLLQSYISLFTLLSVYKLTIFEVKITLRSLLLAVFHLAPTYSTALNG